jgi:hypothetical protein
MTVTGKNSSITPLTNEPIAIKQKASSSIEDQVIARASLSIINGMSATRKKIPIQRKRKGKMS